LLPGAPLAIVLSLLPACLPACLPASELPGTTAHSSHLISGDLDLDIGYVIKRTQRLNQRSRGMNV
jgi:hypothetical protein